MKTNRSSSFLTLGIKNAIFDMKYESCHEKACLVKFPVLSQTWLEKFMKKYLVVFIVYWQGTLQEMRESL